MSLSLNKNNLYVTPELFASLACLDGRIYGVKTACDRCTQDVNDCLRRYLLDRLIANQAVVENELGWNLTERYHVQEIAWDGRSRIQLKWPGIESVNVVQTITDLEDSFTISPFVIEDAPVTLVDGVCVVELDSDFVDNPALVTLRNATTGSSIPPAQIAGYPRKNGSGNWLVPLSSRVSDPCDVTINVQHCRLMRLTVPTQTCADGTVYPVYPGTQDIIPYAKDPVVDGSNTTYWFNAWSLADPAFMFNGTIDLEAGEFYKLITEVNFICVTETDQPAILYEVNNSCADFEITQDTTALRLDIVSAERAIVRVLYEDRECQWRCKTPLKIKVFYKTNPQLVQPNIEASLYAIQEGIAYLTAAELPLELCDCVLKKGFISTAQESYAQAFSNPVSGETVYNYKFGMRHGQLVFAERLNKAYHYRPLVVL